MHPATTTVGQWVCGFCIGNPGRPSGLAEIALVKGLGELVIQSEPTEGVKGPFQAEGRQSTNKITIIFDQDNKTYDIP